MSALGRRIFLVVGRPLRLSLGYDVSSVCRLSFVCNAYTVAKRYVLLANCLNNQIGLPDGRYPVLRTFAIVLPSALSIGLMVLLPTFFSRQNGTDITPHLHLLIFGHRPLLGLFWRQLDLNFLFLSELIHKQLQNSCNTIIMIVTIETDFV